MSEDEDSKPSAVEQFDINNNNNNDNGKDEGINLGDFKRQRIMSQRMGFVRR
jgi:hypothetical protein